MNAHFQAWLEEQPYRHGTKVKTLRDVAYARRLFDNRGELPKSAVPALRRYVLYLEQRDGFANTDFDQAVAGSLTATREPQEKHGRKLPERRFVEGDWDKLVVELEGDRNPCAVVLYIMCCSGMRIGDVLRVRRSDLSRAKRTGVLQLEQKGGYVVEVALEGASEAWGKLDRAWRTRDQHELVASFVCPAGDGSPEAGSCAYKAVARYLKKVGVSLKLEGRVHLHRVRRTVALNALHMTKDIHAVSQLLQHRALSSTQHYVDELRVDDVAALQKKLRGVK